VDNGNFLAHGAAIQQGFVRLDVEHQAAVEPSVGFDERGGIRRFFHFKVAPVEEVLMANIAIVSKSWCTSMQKVTENA
jgi:hypothetical protein